MNELYAAGCGDFGVIVEQTYGAAVPLIKDNMRADVEDPFVCGNFFLL